MFSQHRRFFLRSIPASVILLFTVSACVKSTLPAPTPVSEATPTVSVSTAAPGETLTAPTLAPTDATPTVTPITVIVAASQAIDNAARQTAQEFGWIAGQAADASIETLRPLAESGVSIIVAEGGGGDVRALADEFPHIYFVAVNSVGENWPTNALALGGPGSRYDQLGFLAGMTAGYATETKTVTAITDLSVTGLNYRNGFLHGVRYTCPRCQLQYIDVFDVEQGGAEAAQTAALYASISSDVFFASAGRAGLEALQAAAQAGAWVIGAHIDIYFEKFGGAGTRSVAGADQVLTSFYFDSGALVASALTHYHAGQPFSGAQPFSAANNAIAIAPYRTDALNALDQQEIAAALARLANGSLDTGIDPATGQEK